MQGGWLLATATPCSTSTKPFMAPLPTIGTKVYNWRQKGTVAQSASALIMEYMGAFEDAHMARLQESWEGLGLVRQQTFPRSASMVRTASVKAMYEKDDVQTLVRGAWVFKHGRRGRPKRRKVRVNSDLTKVVWGTNKQMPVEVRCNKHTRDPTLESVGSTRCMLNHRIFTSHSPRTCACSNVHRTSRK